MPTEFLTLQTFGKALGAISVVARKIWTLISDRTNLSFQFEKVDGYEENSVAPIRRADGQVILALVTGGGGTVELTRIEIHYAPPLQLFDPGNLGFFVQGFGGGRVNDCPFMLEWNGKYELPPKCTTPFALIANFQNGAIERNIVLRATARRKKKGFFGYENFGTPQTAEIKIKVVDTANHIHGMSIPPKCGMLVFQPFFAQGNTEIRSGHGHVVAHEGMQDGTVKSTSYYIPEQPDK